MPKNSLPTPHDDDGRCPRCGVYAHFDAAASTPLAYGSVGSMSQNVPVEAAIVMRCQACHDAALAYGIPFISGKDSLNNSFVAKDGTKISIPHTLLVSSLIGVIDCDRRLQVLKVAFRSKLEASPSRNRTFCRLPKTFSRTSSGISWS